ncbi:IQ domain-containing protein E [Liparis tanakae]|uniref:IQ domain-containing protein E n=1 Tax=Liparis tanakae TaxID=230148 RepID=A0A4Z2FS01_9TELE|nr:IQ domain-containing protein E [Liparis tanakae]
MFGVKMSLEASDVQTDEDCEELVSPASFGWLHDTNASQTLRSECDVTPELLRQTLSARKHRHLHSGSNGFSGSTGDPREKEDMYDEIIQLKKSLQAQKSDNQQMKARLRRLEEDNAKREKQIEELLDPTKGSEYTRSFVDKKKEGSVVLNGLKQRILKLEQQCREKENALSKLQSELRTTNLEELKITVETYFDERLEDGRGPAQSAKLSGRLDREVQTTPTEILGFTMATEAAVSVGTNTEEGEELSGLRERLGQSEKEGVELQERLSSKDDELRRARTEREESEAEARRWRAEQTDERDKEGQQHQQELAQLLARIQTLEERSRPAQAELPSLPGTSPEVHEDTRVGAGPEGGGERLTGKREEEEEEEEGGGGGEEELKREREKSALVIQTNWREHRNRDVVLLQSALRAHLLRESRLTDLLRETQNKAAEATNRSDAASSAGGDLDVVALTMVQSAFRGHLARCSRATESPGFSVPSLMGNEEPTLSARRAPSTHTASTTDGGKKGQEEDPWLSSSSHSSRMTPPTGQPEPRRTAASAAAAGPGSDDSDDDIIVSPSRPLRSREVFVL